MGRFARMGLSIAVSIALVATAAFVVFQGRSSHGRPAVLPVARGEHEIAWLYPATSASSWERLVAAVGRSAERLRADYPEIAAVIGPTAFPRQTNAVPQVELQWSGGRLVFRWYKLTSDWKTRDWIGALLDRAQPPLAIVGGSSSDSARELAVQLQHRGAHLDESRRPVLILTTATADRVREEDEEPGAPAALPEAIPPGEDSTGVRLIRLYPGRTFRFCFTNRQMAVALTHFLWSRDDLRPDADPVHLVRWEDDSYSRDLVEGFWQALRGLMTEETAAEFGWVTGGASHGGATWGLGGGIAPLGRLGAAGSGFRMNRLPTPQFIDSSVGTFHAPNRFEAQAARFLLLDLPTDPSPRRPLLVVTGQAAPSRRFLRALARTAPMEARKFVVATGDAVAFNAVYRDRRVSWPIQDLPFDLVLFCHHNPIDSGAGFRPDVKGRSGAFEEDLPAATGTEDFLLFGDIVEAIARATLKDGVAVPNAAALADRLTVLRLGDEGLGYEEGGPLFTPNGNRRGGTGEHIVCLRPRFQGDRVLPEATLEVWAWRNGPEGGRVWGRVGEPLPLAYDETPAGGSDP